MGGGSSAIIQKYENGFVDPFELTIDSAIGGFGGALGGGAPLGVTKMGGGLVARKTAEVTVGNLAEPIINMPVREQPLAEAGLNYTAATIPGFGAQSSIESS